MVMDAARDLHRFGNSASETYQYSPSPLAPGQRLGRSIKRRLGYSIHWWTCRESGLLTDRPDTGL